MSSNPAGSGGSESYEPEKVLVIDDERLIRNMAGDIIAQTGCVTVEAASGREAIELLATLQPLLVFLDLYLPDEPGDEVCRIIKGNRELSAVPVVMMTAADSEDDVRRSFLAGADDFLPKPIREELMISKLVSALAGMRKAVPTHKPVPGKTVLIAEDDAFFRAVLGHLLERSGYQTVYCETGLDALRTLLMGKVRPDLCVVDLVMPGIGGLELVRKLRDQPQFKDLPILVMSAVARSPGMGEALRRVGVGDVVDKNAINLEAVLTRINAELFKGKEVDTSARAQFYRVCEFRREGDEEWLTGFVYNLSETGISIRTLTPAGEGAWVDVRFPLDPGGPRWTTRTQVAWASEFDSANRGAFPYGMGLKFVDVDEKTRVWIRKYIREALALAAS